MEINWTPKPTPKPLENNPTIIGMLQSRGDAAIMALETIHAHLRGLTQEVGRSLMDLRKLDNKVGIPSSPEQRRASMLDNVRRARPDLADATDAQVMAAIRNQPKAPQ